MATPTLEWLFPIGGIYLACTAPKPNQPVSNGLAQKGDGYHTAGGLTPLRANCFAEGGTAKIGRSRQPLRGAQPRPWAGRAQAAIIVAHGADGGVEVAGGAASTAPITRWSAPDFLAPYETLPAGYLPSSLTASTEEVSASPLDPRHAVMPGMLKEHTFKVWGIFDVAARPRTAPSPTG
ncbi:MAG TPA: hypothetical protein VF503_09750 [Sphingobium sp.]|uniref:hypothetical protein n=1 Tax=Sphingobium sp. TaxID=1912891 RepID=UPI002ED3941A